MKLAIQQPYFLPYLGYWQLLASVDRFVLYDDVQFIRNGWINRNRMLLHGAPAYFTIPVARSSYLGPIVDARIAPVADWAVDLKRRVRAAYRSAPWAGEALALLDGLLAEADDDLNRLVGSAVRRVAAYLGLRTEIVCASGRWDNGSLRGKARVLDICRREGATTYLNLPGGRAIYEARDFQPHGIALGFIDPDLTPYAQGDRESSGFVPGLSVLDALAWAGPEATSRMARSGRCAVSP